MGFSSEVRERALVAAARHCCLCNRYKGVRVEVHHIIPVSKGGTDDYENAISLCFDCHADAGHYNPDHPKGSRISPRELRSARDRWHKTVERNAIRPLAEPDSWYCRYVLCKNFEALHEICESNLIQFPVDRPILVRNPVLEFLCAVLATHAKGYHAASSGKQFPSKEEYQKAYPDARQVDKTTSGFSYYDLVRVPSEEELYKGPSSENGIVQLMLHQGIEPKEIARAVTYENGCGGIICQEMFIYRPLWGAFLACSNITDKPVTIESIHGSLTNNPKTYVPFLVSDTPFVSWPLPAAPIPPGWTVIIPVAVILAPIGHVPFSELTRVTSTLNRGQIQEVIHGAYDKKDLTEFRFWGPYWRPTGFRFGGTGSFQPIYALDLSNLYTIDRYWEMGSCPHLFVMGDTCTYVGEILAQCDGVVGAEVIRLDPNIKTLVIAELENETTELWSVELDGVCIIQNRLLMPGEEIRMPIPNGSQKMRVVGRYLRNIRCSLIRERSIEATCRNALVSQYLAHWPCS